MEESLASSDIMEEPEPYDPIEDIKTKFVTINPEDKMAFENRKITTMFGTDTIQYKWLDLTCGTKVEEVKRFGHGGYSDVILYRCKKDGKMFIVKKNCKNSNSDGDTVNEIRQMTKIESDYVIRCYGYSLTNDEKGTVAIVMEFGGDQMDKFLRKYRPKTDSLRAILETVLVKVANGLVDIHRRGLMHRDIKEANIYVTKIEDGTYQVKIGDFGITILALYYRMIV